MPSGLGVGVPWQRAEGDPGWYDRALEALRPNWFYNWQHDLVGRPNYCATIWRMDAEGMTRAIAVAQANAADVPLWLLGNEPEREAQSDTPAHIAAAACRQWVRALGTWAVPWAAPGVNLSVHMFEQGRVWLDGFLAAGAPLPDAWAIHVYGGADAWRDSLHRFRAWMRARHVERPVIVSECGTDTDAPALLAAIRASLDSGEVQAAALFSARYPPWPALDLLTDACELTALGRLFVGEAMPAGEGGHVVHLPAVWG